VLEDGDILVCSNPTLLVLKLEEVVKPGYDDRDREGHKDYTWWKMGYNNIWEVG